MDLTVKIGTKPRDLSAIDHSAISAPTFGFIVILDKRVFNIKYLF
jgi:hypothetical protein